MGMVGEGREVWLGDGMMRVEGGWRRVGGGGGRWPGVDVARGVVERDEDEGM